MEKKGLIMVSLFILVISLFSVFAEEVLEEDSVLVPIEEVEAEPTLYEDEASEELLDEEIQAVPEEVEEVVEELPEEISEEEEELEVELISEAEPELIDEEVESEPKPSLFARGRSLAGAGINKARGIAGWFITRDYVSVAKNFARILLGLSIWLKLLLIFFALIFILIVWSYFFRDTRANNLRRARRLHRRGERAHNKGNEEKAELCYAKSAEYREKAQDQW